MNEIDSFDRGYVCFKCWHQINSFHQFYIKVAAIHRESSIGCDALINTEMELYSPNNFDDDNDKVIDLEIDFLESDAASHQNGDEIYEESLTEFPTTSDNESMLEYQNRCIKNRTISKHSVKREPKKQIKIMKMQTIEQIVYAYHFFILVEFKEDHNQIFTKIHLILFYFCSCYMCHESFAGFWELQNHLSSHSLIENHLENSYMSSQHKKSSTKDRKGIMCKKKFKSEHLLAQHAMTHVNRKQCHSTVLKHQCTICSKSFARPNKLKVSFVLNIQI